MKFIINYKAVIDLDELSKEHQAFFVKNKDNQSYSDVLKECVDKAIIGPNIAHESSIDLSVEE